MIFGLGVLTGIALVVELIKRALENHRSAIDLFCHWNDDRVFICNRYGTNNTGEYEGSNDTSYVPSVFFIIGIAIVFGLEKIKAISE